jgi:dihydrofolate reductase
MKSAYISKYGIEFEYTLDNCVLEINEVNLMNVPLTIATDGLSKTEQEILWDIVCKQAKDLKTLKQLLDTLGRTKMQFISICAHVNGILGVNDGLPVRSSADLKLFKQLTLGEVIVMGRKTLESLPRKLEGRYVVCLTRDKGYTHPYADAVFNDPIDIIMAFENTTKRLIIAGGAEIYNLFKDHVESSGFSIVTEHHMQPEYSGDDYITLCPSYLSTPDNSDVLIKAEKDFVVRIKGADTSKRRIGCDFFYSKTLEGNI